MAAHVTPGKLKLKGGVPPPKIEKKKRKARLSDTNTAAAPPPPPQTQAEDAQQQQQRYSVPYTPAELEFALAQAKREKERVRKAAEKTHRERIDEFNRKLDKLSEHHDIPRIGPG